MIHFRLIKSIPIVTIFFSFLHSTVRVHHQKNHDSRSWNSYSKYRTRSMLGSRWVDTWISFLLILFLFEAYETVLNDPTLCRPPYYSPGTISCSNIRTCYSRWSTFLFYDDNRTRWRKYCCLVLVGITTARNPPAWGEIPKKQKGLLLLLLVFYLWRKSNETLYHIFVHSIKMF